MDPRALHPLDEKAILSSVHTTGRLVAVDEAHSPCGAAGHITAIAAERAFDALKGPIRRVCVADVAMPFSPPLEQALLPGKDGIVQSVRSVPAHAAMTA